jgi:hypothetical protein
MSHTGPGHFIYRDAGNGKVITQEEAERNPATTVKEWVPSHTQSTKPPDVPPAAAAVPKPAPKPKGGSPQGKSLAEQFPPPPEMRPGPPKGFGSSGTPHRGKGR